MGAHATRGAGGDATPAWWLARKRTLGPAQLGSSSTSAPFVPRDYEFDYRVIATNKTSNADAIRLCHHGRGTQEGLIGEAKTHAQLDYVPTRKLVANQLFLTASLMAHNLGRELQMTAKPRSRTTSPTRAALWEFENLGTLRHRLFQRARVVSFRWIPSAAMAST